MMETSLKTARMYAARALRDAVYKKNLIPKCLHLNLKGVYFDEIKAGTKTHEFRLVTPYWTKRLVGREYDCIVIKRGYPASGDMARQLIRPYQGYEMRTITHEHFGAKPVEVYAIRVNEPTA